MTGKRSVLSVVMGFIFLLGEAGLAVAAPAKPPELKKLKAYAFVTVKPVSGAAKTTIAFVMKTARTSIPAAAFGELIVVTEGKLDEAKGQARDAKADVFLHVVVDNPKRVTLPVRWPLGAILGGRGGRSSRSISTLRTHVGVQMSILNAGNYRRVKSVKLSSADAPPAEAGIIANDTDTTAKWATGVKITVPAAVERALGEYFFRGVTLKAVQSAPEDVDVDDIDLDAGPPKPKIRIELTNRSHCRVTDATVTVERYDTNLKRWEPIDGYFRLGPRGDRGGRGGRGGRGDAGGRGFQLQAVTNGSGKWTFLEEVEPGEQALSEEQEVAINIFNTMTGKTQCRFVLHAAPAVGKLIQPAVLHKLKPRPKPKRAKAAP